MFDVVCCVVLLPCSSVGVKLDVCADDMAVYALGNRSPMPRRNNGISGRTGDFIFIVLVWYIFWEGTGVGKMF